jgi:preprotein translocase subunit SecB
MMANSTNETDGQGSQAAADGPEAKGGNGGTTPEQAPLTINSQYIKDLSFEVPGAPQIFGQIQNQTPDITINVNVQATPLGGNAYEVVLHARAECKASGATAFIAELSYGGVFTIHVPQEHLRPVLLIECPRILFPFARHILANTTREGGFLPLMLGPIDFVAMYQRHAAQQPQQPQPPAPAEGT